MERRHLGAEGPVRMRWGPEPRGWKVPSQSHRALMMPGTGVTPGGAPVLHVNIGSNRSGDEGRCQGQSLPRRTARAGIPVWARNLVMKEPEALFTQSRNFIQLIKASLLPPVLTLPRPPPQPLFRVCSPLHPCGPWAGAGGQQGRRRSRKKDRAGAAGRVSRPGRKMALLTGDPLHQRMLSTPSSKRHVCAPTLSHYDSTTRWL